MGLLMVKLCVFFHVQEQQAEKEEQLREKEEREREAKRKKEEEKQKKLQEQKQWVFSFVEKTLCFKTTSADMSVQ